MMYDGDAAGGPQEVDAGETAQHAGISGRRGVRLYAYGWHKQGSCARHRCGWRRWGKFRRNSNDGVYGKRWRGWRFVAPDRRWRWNRASLCEFRALNGLTISRRRGSRNRK